MISEGNLRVGFISHNRPPKCAPNPDYPHGKHVDSTEGKRPACHVELPYPAECCGVWMVSCRVCQQVVAVTAAGRPDDPKRLSILCKAKS